MDMVLNNLQRLICHETQQTKPSKQKTDVKLLLLKETFNCSYIYIFFFFKKQ